ncbi:YozQ family protein [Metabacillus iocasae]|uniref:DUF4025 domain-containing protein n=1 Tax=Priestia iocasae TaxID=2291674 RepID=A0ABS2QZW8_9BACI|nr:YozQ family protein [Metabacillus iocasae]MBM7704557.1 hypothetical protein [Metabacillus iocasae]
MDREPKQGKKNELHTEEMADRQFEVQDYSRQDELSQGLATTHEQVSDAYNEGTVEDTNR